MHKLSGFKLPPVTAGHINRLVQETDEEVEARARVTLALEPCTEEEISRLNAIKTGHVVDDISKRVNAFRAEALASKERGRSTFRRAAQV